MKTSWEGGIGREQSNQRDKIGAGGLSKTKRCVPLATPSMAENVGGDGAGVPLFYQLEILASF